MNFWVNKIIPARDDFQEKVSLKLLKYFDYISIGFHEFAKEFPLEFINNTEKHKKISKFYLEKLNDWFSKPAYNGQILNFICEMQINDIVLIPLTKQYNQDIYFVRIESDCINIAKNEMLKTLTDSQILGFARKVKVLYKCTYDNLPENLKIMKNYPRTNKNYNEKTQIILDFLDSKIL